MPPQTPADAYHTPPTGDSTPGESRTVLNPRRDPAGLTARVAAKLVKEIAARMLRDTETAP